VRALRHDLSKITLSGELMRIADRFRANTDMDVRLRLPDREVNIGVDTIRHLGYIVTEALANTWKHAGVDRATVAVAANRGRLAVRISDRGRGFEPDQEEVYQAGLGLQNMRERAQEIGARLEISSTPGTGTRIVVSLPVLTVQED
jgi:signal transduction histidine kinase